ncbi:MAG: YHYH protein [Gammaproteobacteria bacterium]
MASNQTRRFRTPLAFALSSLLAMSPLQVSAHGVHDTGAASADAERPPMLWEYLLSAAEAAMSMRMDEQGGYRYIESDGLADHATGRFPNRGNPHSIERQSYHYRMPLKPSIASRRTPIGHSAFGVAINGVPFDPATAEYWRNDRQADWNYEALTGGLNLGLDDHNAHVQPNGAYHYHGLPTGLLKQGNYRRKPMLIGYAADGFPIYSPYGYSKADDASSRVRELKPSYLIKQGTRPGGPGGRYDGRFTRDWEYKSGSGDLDDYNGRTGVTQEYPGGTYYYVITDAFPSIPRCWVGRGDSSFQKRPGGSRGMGSAGMQRGGRGGPETGGQRMGGQGQGQRQGQGMGMSQGRRGPPGGGPPQEAIDICDGKREGVSCSFPGRGGREVSGSCRSLPDGKFACAPRHRR